MKVKLIIAALLLTGAVYGGYKYQYQKEQKIIAGSCCKAEGTCSGDKSCTLARTVNTVSIAPKTVERAEYVKSSFLNL